MNKSQILEMRSTIKTEYETKIKKLKDEMEEVLSSFSRVEKTLAEEASQANIGPMEPTTHIKIERKKRFKKSNRESEKQRVITALQEMDPKFSTGELKEKINNDGTGKEIKKGTFAGIFADLMKTRKIIVLQERKGSQGGVYKKSE